MTSAARMRSVEIRGFVSTSVATTHMWQSLGIFSPESPYISFIFIFLPDFQVTLYDEHCSSDSGQHSGEPADTYCCSLCETQVSENIVIFVALEPRNLTYYPRSLGLGSDQTTRILIVRRDPKEKIDSILFKTL